MRFLLVLVAVVAAGCSAVQRRGGQLRERAGFDMRCEPGALQITEIDRRTAGVEGCGQRGVYVWSDQGMWVLNSPDSGGSSELTSPPDSSPPGPRSARPHGQQGSRRG
jgi:hypothetical protein